MKIMLKGLTRFGGAALIIAAIGVAGCKSSGDRTSSQRTRDREVARGVNKKLADDPTFKYSDVKTYVYDGNVQLAGFVELAEQRLRAAEIAAQTKGAKQVINDIMIKPTPVGRATIRDPLGHETGRVLVDTNYPAPHMRNLPPPGQEPGSTGSENAPK